MYSVSCIHYRDGAEGARGAHNPEVVGSNPTSGITHLSAFQKPMMVNSSSDLKQEQPETGMAQRERAGLITPRTQDRNLLPVLLILCCLLEPHPLSTQQLLTGMAQRQRAWLITTRTQDRNLLPVFIILCSLLEPHPLSTQQHYTALAHQKSARLITVR